MAEYTIDKIEYNGDTFNLSPNVVYATCPTAAGTAAKVATITSGTLTSLNAGDQVIVKFTYANGKASPTLKVGSTDAKSIMRYGTTTPGTSAASSWNAGSCVLFVYDGTYWQQIGFLNSTYTVTDKKLEIAAVSNGSIYYPVLALDSTSAATRQYDKTGIIYEPTASGAKLTVGSGSKQGILLLNGSTTYAHTIQGAPTAARTLTLPDKSGTIALTDDIPTIPTDFVTKITTTAGAHTAITNATGAVSFNVPTTAAHVGAAASDHTHGNITNGGDITATAPTIASGDQIIINDHSASKITNGPTFDGSTTTTALTPKGTWESFAKSDTNTTYALSGALSSHKFTSTLTAGGSGSGTSTSDFTLAAGTGITITDDTSNRKMTIACSVTNTDTKVSTAAITSEASYYPVLGSDTTAAETKFYDNTGFGYTSRIGTASTEGTAVIALGNNISTGTAGNKSGRLLLYGKNSYTASILTADLTAHTTIKFPNKSGTIALTSDVTDTKVSTAAITSGTIYYPVLGSDTTSAETKFYDKTGIKYSAVPGVPYDYSTGDAALILGNNTQLASNGWKRGVLRLYSRYDSYANLVYESTNSTTITLPYTSGTIALQEEIPAVSTLYINEDEENPGTYIGSDMYEVADAYNMLTTTNISSVKLCFMPIDTNQRYMLTASHIEDIIDENDYAYSILWFSGTFSKRNSNGNLQLCTRITCGVPYDMEEQYYTNGEVFVDIREIGERYTINGGDTGYTTNISTTADQFKQLAVLNLPAGRWIVTARARFTPTSSSNHYSAINIGTTTAGSGSTTTGNAIRDRRYGEGTYFNQHTLTRIIAVDVLTPIYLNGGGSNVAGTWTRTNDVFQFDAIRIR